MRSASSLSASASKNRSIGGTINCTRTTTTGSSSMNRNAHNRNVVTSSSMARPGGRVSTDTGGGGGDGSGSSSSGSNPTAAAPTYTSNAGSRVQMKIPSQIITVDKQIVDELLLVCGVIGTTTTFAATPDGTTAATGSDSNSNAQAHAHTTIVPVTDCVQWLQDLQRCLRRDDDVTRPISMLLHSWNIVVSKLLPLIVNVQYDTTLLLTICKIIVLLTKPLHSQTIAAGKMMINTKHSKSIGTTGSTTGSHDISDASLLQEQIKLRDNALLQASILMDYKRAFCHFGSTLSSQKTKQKKNGIFSIFVALLAEPLSRVGNTRTDSDHLTIELIIYLFRNLLIAEPILNTSGTSTLQRSSSSNTNDLHYEIVTIFEEELVLDILYVLCADIEQRENVSYNLLLMELIQLLFKHQNPTMIATTTNGSNDSSTNQQQQQRRPTLAIDTVSSTRPISKPNKNNSLLRSIQREKQSMQFCSTSRHSHFGGTIVLENKLNGQKQLIGASIFNTKQASTMTSTTSNRNNSSCSQPQQLLLLSRRKNKNLEPFIGANHHKNTAGSTATANGINDIYVSVWHKKSMRTLHEFCTIFVLNSKCYGPLMKSLKNEFRRDSVRLEDNDRIVYFQMVTFFCTWYRTNLKTQQKVTSTNARTGSVDPNDDCVESDSNASFSSPSSIGQLIFTMDVFSFNLVLNATDTFQEHKKYGPLSHSVALLREMMHLLYAMMQNASTNHQNTDSTSSVASTANATEQIMAMGLMDRIFYATEPLDRLPKLLSRWTPGTSTREYVCDLVEITHMTLQVLEANSKLCRSANDRSTHNNNDDSMKHDTVAKMKAMAIAFDIEAYFVRRIVSNHTLAMYTHLLSCYAINTPEINQYVLSFFERVRQHILSSPSDNGVGETLANAGDNDANEDTTIKNPFIAKVPVATMEPMLYNAHLFVILNNILNDTLIRSDSDYTNLIDFATSIVHNFAAAVQSNPVLFIEVFFKHPSPHRFCDMVTNSYVSEDLRMLVERDILLQQQYQLEQEFEAFNSNNNQHDLEGGPVGNFKDDKDESSDEELEFTDVPLDDSMTIHNQSRLMCRARKLLTKSKSTVLGCSDKDSDSDDEYNSIEKDKETTGRMLLSAASSTTNQYIDENESHEENGELFSIVNNGNRRISINGHDDREPNLGKRNLPESISNDDDLSKKPRTKSML